MMLKTRKILEKLSVRWYNVHHHLLRQQNDLSISQKQAVECSNLGLSIFVHLQTGSGKSLTYQIPALMAPAHKITIIVSPLVALINDQVASLRQHGIDAVKITSEKRKTPLMDEIGGRQILYTTPEFLTKNVEMLQVIRSLMRQKRLIRLVLDEAHCLLEWGNTFRPSYLDLITMKERYMDSIPLTFTTASVSEYSINLIANSFGLNMQKHSRDAVQDSKMLSLSERAKQLMLIQQLKDRPNLHISVIDKKNINVANLIASKTQQKTTIVYCLTRKEAEKLCLELIELGYHAGVYHGGMTYKRREHIQKQWMGGHISIVCATSAFGMGIDRADVRYVIHSSIPPSLSAYYQQIVGISGRAGRDGNASQCLLLFDESDRTRALSISSSGTTEDSNYSNTISKESVDSVVEFCTSMTCRRQIMYGSFGYSFDKASCSKNCTCKSLVKSDTNYYDLEDVSIQTRADKDELNLNKWEVEFLYQKILAEAKQSSLPRRETLSRKTIQEIFKRRPSSIQEMAEIRGVGFRKANRFFKFFSDP